LIGFTKAENFGNEMAATGRFAVLIFQALNGVLFLFRKSHAITISYALDSQFTGEHCYKAKAASVAAEMPVGDAALWWQILTILQKC
jgi:hypothetical protein